jgi:hypothetical protein
VEEESWMYMSSVSSEYGNAVGESCPEAAFAEAVVWVSIGIWSADARALLRCSLAHSSSHFNGVAFADDGGLSLDALHLLSCLSRPHAQVFTTIA